MGNFRFLKPTIHSVFIMLGEDCNFSCRYCLQKPIITESIKKDVNPEIYDFLLDLASTNEINLTFFGGEPLLYWENIKEAVLNLNSDKIHFSITSNGSLLTEDKVDFINDNDISFCLSHDGANVEKTRLVDVFKNDEIKRLFFKINRKVISAVCCSETSNILDIVDYVDRLSEEYSKIIDQDVAIPLNLDLLLDTGLCNKYLTDINFEELEKSLDVLCDRYKRYINGEIIKGCSIGVITKFIEHIKYNIVSKPSFLNMPSCSVGYGTLNMDLDGNFYLCHNSSTQIGGINKSLYEYLSNFVPHDKYVRSEECKNCDVFYGCKGGCLLVGDDARKAFYCKLNKLVYGKVQELILLYKENSNESSID